MQALHFEHFASLKAEAEWTAIIHQLHASFPGKFCTSIASENMAFWEHHPDRSAYTEQALNIDCSESEQLVDHLKVLSSSIGVSIPLPELPCHIQLDADALTTPSPVHDYYGKEIPCWLVHVPEQQEGVWDIDAVEQLLRYYGRTITTMQVRFSEEELPIIGAFPFPTKASMLQLLVALRNCKGIIAPANSLLAVLAKGFCPEKRFLNLSQHKMQSAVQFLFDSYPGQELFPVGYPFHLKTQTSNRHSKAFIQSIPEYPNTFSGRGIVMCAGGPTYFTCAWVAIRTLRKNGCTLPIEVWYMGPDEMDDNMKELLTPFNVHFMDAVKLRATHPTRILSGWEMNPYAIIHSRFEEVIFLDADNHVLIDPAVVFDWPQYLKHGAIFWPDFNKMSPRREIYKAVGIPRRLEQEFESGQIVIHKKRCWRALNLALWYNEYSDFFYDLIWGDKDTYRLAWHKLEQSFAFVPHPIHALEYTMCQHDFDGNIIFQHRNTDKWSLTETNERVEGFEREEEALEYLEELKGLWDGTVRTP